MRKNKVEPVAEYKRLNSDAKKDLINLVVVGHVDSGKSTLMGHLLVDLGQVNSKVMHKYEQESRKLGKQVRKLPIKKGIFVQTEIFKKKKFLK